MPIIGCEGFVCFMAIVWHSEQLSEFLAWWMPVNLVTYLAVLAISSGVFGWRTRPEATELKRLLLVMFTTLPFLAVLLCVWVIDELFLKSSRKQKQRELNRRNHEAYAKLNQLNYGSRK